MLFYFYFFPSLSLRRRDQWQAIRHYLESRPGTKTAHKNQQQKTKYTTLSLHRREVRLRTSPDQLHHRFLADTRLGEKENHLRKERKKERKKEKEREKGDFRERRVTGKKHRSRCGKAMQPSSPWLQELKADEVQAKATVRQVLTVAAGGRLRALVQEPDIGIIE